MSEAVRDDDGAVELSFHRDDAYLRAHYRAWLFSRSGWRRAVWLGSLLLAVIAIIAAFVSDTPALRLPATLVAAFGLAQAVVPLFEFRRWKRAALGGLDSMPDLQLSVRDGVLRFGAGPDLRYEANGDAVPVVGGWFVYERARVGRHFYLPRRWLERQDARALFDAWAGFKGVSP